MAGKERDEQGAIDRMIVANDLEQLQRYWNHYDAEERRLQGRINFVKKLKERIQFYVMKEGKFG